MQKPIQTDTQKCKMPVQIKSLNQNEVLLPMLEGKCDLLLLDKNQEMFFYMRFLTLNGILERGISVIGFGLPTGTYYWNSLWLENYMNIQCLWTVVKTTTSTTTKIKKKKTTRKATNHWYFAYRRKSIFTHFVQVAQLFLCPLEDGKMLLTGRTN